MNPDLLISKNCIVWWHPYIAVFIQSINRVYFCPNFHETAHLCAYAGGGTKTSLDRQRHSDVQHVSLCEETFANQLANSSLFTNCKVKSSQVLSNAVITIAIRLRSDYDPTTTYRALACCPFDASKNEHVSFSSQSYGGRIAVELQLWYRLNEIWLTSHTYFPFPDYN